MNLTRTIDVNSLHVRRKWNFSEHQNYIFWVHPQMYAILLFSAVSGELRHSYYCSRKWDRNSFISEDFYSLQELSNMSIIIFEPSRPQQAMQEALRDKVITHCPPKILSDMCGALYQHIFYFPAQNNSNMIKKDAPHCAPT